MATVIIVSLIFLALSALVTLICQHGADGRLEVNDLIGIRTKATKSSPEAWRRGHQAAYRPSLGLIGATFIAGLVATLLVPTMHGSDATPALLFIPIVVVLGGVIWLGVIANRAAKTADVPVTPSREASSQDS